MQIAEIIDKKATRPVRKILLGVFFLGFIILIILWFPDISNYINGIANKSEPVMVEVETVEDETPENLSIPTEASGNDVIPKNDAELEEEAFPPTESLGEFEITERNLPERGFESVEQSPTVVYKGEVEDHNSTTEKGVDIKGIATGFVGVIQGLSLLILTWKKILSKGK